MTRSTFKKIADLAQLEAVIAAGEQGAVDRALAAIKARQLYHRTGRRTFKSYCAARWPALNIKAT
jgi:hypothetical protein